MNNEIKLNLNITVPGRVMMSEQLCSENNKYDNVKISLNVKGKRELLDVKVRSTISAKQSINISKEAYEYFIGKEAPYFMKQKEWARLSKQEKLRAHLDEIVANVGGISYTYKIFEE